MTRQQRRAEERQAAKADTPGKGIKTEHAHGRGWRIKMGGIYMMARNGKGVMYFDTEQEAKDLLEKLLAKMEADWADRKAKLRASIKAEIKRQQAMAAAAAEEKA